MQKSLTREPPDKTKVYNGLKVGVVLADIKLIDKNLIDG